MWESASKILRQIGMRYRNGGRWQKPFQRRIFALTAPPVPAAIL
jgi:hypothetical protein